jgi:hypothetical protein
MWNSVTNKDELGRCAKKWHVLHPADAGSLVSAANITKELGADGPFAGVSLPMVKNLPRWFQIGVIEQPVEYRVVLPPYFAHMVVTETVCAAVTMNWPQPLCLNNFLLCSICVVCS